MLQISKRRNTSTYIGSTEYVLQRIAGQRRNNEADVIPIAAIPIGRPYLG